jgi:undecaprenyl-diphosphatase
VISWGKEPGPLKPSAGPRGWRDSAAAAAVRRWDYAMQRRINHDWDSRFFDRAMPLATDFGDGKTQILLLLVLFGWATYTKRRYWRTTALLALGGVVLAVLAPLIKLVLPRARPPAVIPTTDILLIHPLYGGSFPSGHTLVSFAVATIIACRHRWTAPWAFGLAALVGVSRVSVGVHWPVDVVGGAILGTLVGFLVLALHKRREARKPAAGARGA